MAADSRRDQVSSILPPDLHLNFSKWFYADRESIKPRPRDQQSKDKTHQVSHKGTPDNSLNPVKFKFLTDDLDQNEFIPIKQITNYNLSIVEQDSDSKTSDTTNTQQRKKKKTKKLQLILQSNSTIIDRRPMLKRRKADSNFNGEPLNYEKSGCGSSTPLILPDEDCDDSFDDEIIEIDCG